MTRTLLYVQAALLALAACKPRAREQPVEPEREFELHEPVVLADKQPGPSDVAVDATHLYWTHFGKPLVRRMPRAGGPVETLYEGDGELGGLWIELVGDQLYFSEAFTIQRVAKTGGVPERVATVSQLPARFAADTDGVYSASGAVMQHSRSGNRVVSGGNDLWDVAVDATHVYWLDRDGVFRAPKVGGEQERLAKGSFRWGRLGLSETDVYWGDAVLGSIFAVPKAGGLPRHVAYGWTMASRQMVVDGKMLWVLQRGGELQAIDLATREIATTALGLERGGSADHFYGFVIAGDAIYLASGGQSLAGGGPAVVDLTKPNSQLPTHTYDGEILKLPAMLPRKPIREPGGDLSIAFVYFQGVTSEAQDSNNATQWIEEFKSAYPALGAGTLGLRIVASSQSVGDAAARERAAKVETLVRAHMGTAAKISIAIEPTSWKGDVRIALDEADFLQFIGAPADRDGTRN